MLGYQFIARLDNKRKIDQLQIYLEISKSIVKYMDLKQAVEKAYQHFREPNTFDNLYS